MNLANWRTTIWGSLTLISAFITENPGLISAAIPEGQAKLIFSVAALVSGFITFANTKDRQVSGNGTPSNPTKVAQPDGSNKVVAPIIAALLLSSLAVTGCATKQPYYLSGVQVGLSKEDGQINGGNVGVTFSPDPSYRLQK